MFTIVDLSQVLTTRTLSYPGTERALVAETLDVGETDVLVSRLSFFDLHAGTHMDAPLHFKPGGADIASLPLNLLPIKLVQIDTAQIKPTAVPKDCRGMAVLFSTGWEKNAGTDDYFGTYPGLEPSAASLLVERGAALIGLDTPSVDSRADNPTYSSHRILCGCGIPIVEGLINLRSLASVSRPCWFAAFPLPFAGLEGSPVRAVALVG